MSAGPVLAAIALALLVAGGAAADGVPGTVATDAFDSTQGTVVVRDDTTIDPINAFRTSGGFEDGHVLMRNGGAGSLSFIEFDTPADVTVLGVRLFAHNDGAGNSFRRAMSHFTLRADGDGDAVFETTVADVAIDSDYSQQPGNAAADPTNLDLTLATATATARHWRLEVTQGSDVQPFEGARLVELDALATTSCAVANLTARSGLLAVKDRATGPAAARFSWASDPSAAEYHLNTVTQKSQINASDPLLSGLGVLQCRDPRPVCADPDALIDPAATLFYQAISACGPGAGDEGPVF